MDGAVETLGSAIEQFNAANVSLEILFRDKAKLAF